MATKDEMTEELEAARAEIEELRADNAAMGAELDKLRAEGTMRRLEMGQPPVRPSFGESEGERQDREVREHAADVAAAREGGAAITTADVGALNA